MRPKIISQPSATIRPHFTISYCNNHSTLLGSQRLNPNGENIYIYTTFVRTVPRLI